MCYQLLRRFEKTPPAAGSREADVQRRAQLLWGAYQRGGTDFLVSIETLRILQDPAGTVEQLLAGQ